VQLRLAGRRHMRGHGSAAATSARAASAGTTAGGDPQPVETEPDTDDARP
jgi:hypothetical protein